MHATRAVLGALLRHRAFLTTFALPFIVGCGFVVAGGWLSWQQLHQRPAPSLGEEFALGLIVPVIEPGLYARTHVATQGCENPVRVSVVIGGSLEYWNKAGPATPEAAGFAFTVSDPGVENLRIRFATANEQYGATTRSNDDDIPLAPARALLKQSTMATSSHGYETTVAVATVREWAKHQAPLVVTFTANWLDRRDGASCYLRLPALVGPELACLLAVTERALDAADPLLAKSSDGLICNPESQWTLSGRTVVNPKGGSIDSALSVPPPTSRSSRDESANWVCSAKRAPYFDRVLDPNGSPPLLPPPSKRELRDRTFDSRDCGATAVLTETAGPSRSSFLLLFCGALVALGMTILVETGILAARKAGA